MATINFTDMVYDFSASLQGCPDYTMANAAKSVIIDLCDRGRVWRGFFAPTTTTAGAYSYAPVPQISYAEVASVDSASYTDAGGTKKPLPYKPYEWVIGAYSAWPETATGTPNVFTQAEPATVLLCPVPDTDGAGTLTAYGSMRPTLAATVWVTAMYQAHKQAIYHGVLHRLMMMANRPWSNPQLAQYHGKEWTYLLNAARIRANHGYNAGELQVEMMPLA